MKAFTKAARKVGAETVILGAKRYAADPNLPDRQFVPHPATWLNRGSWDDEPLPPRIDRPTDRPEPASPWDRKYARGPE